MDQLRVFYRVAGLAKSFGYGPGSCERLNHTPSHQKQGVGKLLITFGINRCKELGYPLIIVLGHESYYPKFGFIPAYPVGFTSVFNVTSNAWMVLELIEGKVQEIKGQVAYHSAFFDN